MKISDLPPTDKGRRYEMRAIALREFAGLPSPNSPLDPFELARYANLLVVSFDDLVPLLSEKTALHLVGEGKDSWSGGAASAQLPDGRRIIILNPTHGDRRQRATLMEEISHVFLGHTPSRLAIARSGSDGKPQARDYDAAIEEEAYATGAAALVPYAGLRKQIEAGKSSNHIARHYRVSRALVEYRIKVSRLWDDYKENLFQS